MNPAVARASKHLHFAPSVSVHTCEHLNWVFDTFCLWETSSAGALLGETERRRGCFCTCLYSGGSGITCTLLWNWNWHLALHCFYWAALMCFQKGRCVCVCVCIWSCVCARACVCSGFFHWCVLVFVWCVSSLTGLEGEFLNFPMDSISFVIGWEKARLRCLLKERRPLKLRWEGREVKQNRRWAGHSGNCVVLVALVKTWPCQYYYNERQKLVKLLHPLAGVARLWLHYDQLEWRKY